MSRFVAKAIANLTDVLESGELGRRRDGYEQQLVRAVAARVGSRYGIGRNANLTALAQLVAACGAGTTTEVICDPLAQFGAVAAVQNNAVPRFVDVRADTYSMDPRALERAFNERTKAVIVTHLWGACVDMDEIAQMCQERGVFLIEDCAHAFGSTWRGRHAGTFGDAGVFSMQQQKQFAAGEGGVIVTDHSWLHELLYAEWPSGESPGFMTLNFRMTELVGAVGMARLDVIDDLMATYERRHDMLSEAIRGCSWLRPRVLPEESRPSAYWWSCLWYGDEVGLAFDDFKAECARRDLPLEFHFTDAPTPDHSFFADARQYGEPLCPTRCPLYLAPPTAVDPLTNAREVLDRVIHMSVVAADDDEVTAAADGLAEIVSAF